MASTDLIANINPNRTYGVAPLSVYFDCSGSDGPVDQPWRDLHYHIDFGETTDREWLYGNTLRRSKDWEEAFQAGHVFETPGVFTVTLTLYDDQGNFDTDTVDIIVLNPDVIQTDGYDEIICYSNQSTDGDFTEAPAGATLKVSHDFDDVVNDLDTGKRVLLRRGETWTTSTRYALDFPGPCQLGAFGPASDPKPIIHHTGASSCFVLSDGTPTSSDFRFTDLFLDLDDTGDSAFGQDGVLTTTLWLRCDVRKALKKAWNLSVSGPGANQISEGVHIEDCTADDLGAGSGCYALFGVFSHACIQGCYFDKNAGLEHTLRIQHGQWMVIAHNDLLRGADNKDTLAIRGVEFAGQGIWSPGRYTELFSVNDNYIHHNQPSWGIQLGPSGDTDDERLRKYIFERNFVKHETSASCVRASFCDAGAAFRNNTFLITTAGGCTVMDFRIRGWEPVHVGGRIFNNSVYSPTTGTIIVYYLNEGTDVADNVFKNNLGSAPNGTIQFNDASGTAEESNNLDLDAPFIVAAPSIDSEFDILADVGANYARDAGTDVLGVNVDYKGNVRPNPEDDVFDVGAFEWTAGRPMAMAALVGARDRLKQLKQVRRL